MKRSQIIRKINANLKKISELKAKNIELDQQQMLISDRNMQFVEKMEVIKRKGLPAKEELVGRCYWKDEFKDEDTGRYISVERSRIVRINGEWDY